MSKQWYVRMQPLAEPALEAVRDGKIQIVPSTWAKTYFHWMENIRDWCISRQLWWGHRIPVWYCDQDGEHARRPHRATACPQCGGRAPPGHRRARHLVLLGLWPFSTLGWPERHRS